MHKAHEVLITIAESHATTYATLKETGRTAHAEGDHTLVLIPYIDHPIELFVRALYRINTQQTVPIGTQLVESGVYFLGRIKLSYQGMGLVFIDNLTIDKLIFLLVFHITQ